LRIPTPAVLVDSSRRVARRFPESLIAALAAYAFATQALGGSGSFDHSSWWRWVCAAALGIPSGVALAVVFERLAQAARGIPRVLRPLTALLLFALLAAFGWAWDGWSGDIQMKRLLHLSLGIHLFVAFAPFLFDYGSNAFWQWNRTLFVRFVTAALFSGVLFAGLAIALAAGKPLFGIEVPGDVFTDLWFGIAFLFNTGYFLAGIPGDFDELERDDRYPGGLKVFAQYILAPLVVVYLTILSAYLVRVLVTGQWPKGWIGWLVSSVSVAGMLSLLLVHPVRERAGNRWIAIYSRTFYLVLLPSIAMLFAAIGKRIGQYGMTEDRYFLLVLAGWVALMAVGYGFRRLHDIRWIPITLCVIAFATWWGPWGAYGISRTDQARRLTGMLERYRVFKNGERVTPPPALVPEQRKQLSSSIDYLARTHGVRALPSPVRRLAPSESELRKNDNYRWQRGTLVARAVMNELGIGYIEPWESAEMHHVNYYEQLPPIAVEDVGGFSRIVTFQGVPPVKFRTDEGAGKIDVNEPARALTVDTPGGSHWQVPLDSLIRALELRPFPPPPDSVRRVRYELGDSKEHGRLLIRQLSGVVQADSLRIALISGDLYLGRVAPLPAGAGPARSR